MVAHFQRSTTKGALVFYALCDSRAAVNLHDDRTKTAVHCYIKTDAPKTDFWPFSCAIGSSTNMVCPTIPVHHALPN